MQTLFEKNLEALLGVRFLASEYSTTHGGRMDTLGLDENSYPVIIEYKRNINENVINQGLFYLDWLMDHKADFRLLVQENLGKEKADAIEWSAPRLICIAADFTRYDLHAIKQMGRNIELIRYRRFGQDLLMLDLLTSVSSSSISQPVINPSMPMADAAMAVTGSAKGATRHKTNSESLADAGEALTNLYSDTVAYLLSLGDDVTQKTLNCYFAFKRIKNFVCLEVKPTLDLLRLYLKVDPYTVALEKGFTRNVKNKGHFGTGDLEVTLRNLNDLERAKPLIEKSYESS
ncbi:hypothetical protein Gain_0031_165 [Komagataeibacter intermedius TF2]|uniref:Transporter n=1 Tax=Komagataeibacter intermedius NRIC 0521 TaxID=1307934 RepID=A0ABQ0PH18_9PROT|nr:hypothetical protein Gain_0031_165 [Komagataeibacter intermedius TF2]GBQ67311.1 transporter [Komagataeibacter intermedius NRIC 0521]